MANICCVIAKDAWMLIITHCSHILCHCRMLWSCLAGIDVLLRLGLSSLPLTVDARFHAPSLTLNVCLCVCVPPPSPCTVGRHMDIGTLPCQEFHNAISRSAIWLAPAERLTYVSSWEVANQQHTECVSGTAESCQFHTTPNTFPTCVCVWRSSARARVRQSRETERARECTSVRWMQIAGP